MQPGHNKYHNSIQPGQVAQFDYMTFHRSLLSQTWEYLLYRSSWRT